MDDLFNPSLIISLGPSSGKALELSRKLISTLPEQFGNLIEFYRVEDIDAMRRDLQSIIDERLLSSTHLNRLVDMGFKVRNDNLNSVRMNLYLLWDVYGSDISGCEVIRILTELNYGNMNKDLHSGASLFIIPILEKEWGFEEERRVQSIKALRESLDYISHEDRLLAFDSRLYLLHCVSSDGTRIPMEELEQIAALLVYMNVIPIKDPPLSHYTKRLMMAEGKYKIGTIGISSLTLFKDKLKESFVAQLGCDILGHFIEYDSDFAPDSFRAADFIDYNSLRNKLDSIVSGEQKLLSNMIDEDLSMDLVSDESRYPEIFGKLEKYIEGDFISFAKENIDAALSENNKEFRKTLESEVDAIVTEHSLKTAAIYLKRLEDKAKDFRREGKTTVSDSLTGLKKGMEDFVVKYPKPLWIACGVGAFSIVSLILMAALVFPNTSTAFDILSIMVFLGITPAALFIGARYKRNKIDFFAEGYREQQLRKVSRLLSSYIEDRIEENSKTVLMDINKKWDGIENSIKSSKEARGMIASETFEKEETGSLITPLLECEDRRRFYNERRPDISMIYSRFIKNLDNFIGVNASGLYETVLEFSRKEAAKHLNLDFHQLLGFKYGEKLEEEVGRWLDTGVIKSKYLLQYTNNDRLEEHSLFITSPEVYKITRDIISKKFGNISVVESSKGYLSSISIIRLCFGLDLEGIPSVKN